MEVKLCTDDFNLIMNHNSIILEGKDDFLLAGIATNFSGWGKFRSLSNHALGPDINFDKLDEDKYIADLVLKKEIPAPAAVILTPSSIITNQIVTMGPVSAIVSASKPLPETSFPNNIFISTMVLLDQALHQGTLLKFILQIQEGISSVLWDLGATGEAYFKTQYRPIVIACNGPEDEEIPDEIQRIKDLIQECVLKATFLALEDLEFPPTITQLLSLSGVELDDLVDAGANLLVGVEDSPEIRLKIKKQLKKALDDINVVSLVLAGIRVEDDYQHHRVRGVDVEDDPAYLYADEVLGMAIANQIAGTKAIFNFKRYDEEKPGIISQLGPMLDDVCAGLVAGCMSKIFEE